MDIRTPTNPRFTTFQERNNLLLKYEKIPIKDSVLIMARVLGRMSVPAKEENFWVTLEKFIQEYEERQLTFFQLLTDWVPEVVDKYMPPGLDKGSSNK